MHKKDTFLHVLVWYYCFITTTKGGLPVRVNKIYVGPTRTKKTSRLVEELTKIDRNISMPKRMIIVSHDNMVFKDALPISEDLITFVCLSAQKEDFKDDGVSAILHDIKQTVPYSFDVVVFDGADAVSGDIIFDFILDSHVEDVFLTFQDSSRAEIFVGALMKHKGRTEIEVFC